MSHLSPYPCPVDPGCILSLDVSSTAVGWALWSKAEGRDSGVLDLANISDLRIKRVDMFCLWLTARIKTHKPDLILAEEPFSGRRDGQAAVSVLHHLHGQVHLICYRLQVPWRDLSRKSVTKSVLGWASRPVDPNHVPRKGHRPKMRDATKREVLAAINARHGTRITSDDQADAVAGLDMILAEMAGTGMPQTVKIPDTTAADHGEMVPPGHGESLPLAPARQQLHAAQAAIPLDQIQAPARRQLERALADMGIGDPRLPRPVRKARGRRRATA